MLRYYSYYSVGGYKDFSLGTSELNIDSTFYMPLLGIQRKKAEDAKDKKMLAEVARLDTLPKIQILSKDNLYDMPNNAIRFISHGGYKLAFTHTSGDTYTLILRDILSQEKDESGRSLSFSFMIVANTQSDAKKLCVIAAYWSNHINTVSAKIGSLIKYDREVNGLRFELKEFNNWLNEISSEKGVISTTRGDIELTTPTLRGITDFVISNEGMTKNSLCTELRLSPKTTHLIPYSTVFPLDNESKTKRMKENAKEDAIKNRNKILLYFVVGGLLAFILTLLLATRK